MSIRSAESSTIRENMAKYLVAFKFKWVQAKERHGTTFDSWQDRCGAVLILMHRRDIAGGI